MADIARLAGVSVATVSRALAGSPLINAETRGRIEELARSLHYSVNVGAKNLRIGENRTVAVVLPFDTETRQHVSDPFFLNLLGSIADAVTGIGHELLLSRIDADRLDRAAECYDTGRALGVLMIGQWHHHDQLNDLARRRVPFVVWGAQLPGQLYCTVGSDNEAGGRLAAEHLIAQGARRILFVGDPALPEVALRRNGFNQAMRLAGLSVEPQLLLPVPFAADLARGAIEARCDAVVDFDGVFACSDLLAMTVIAALRRRAVAVPAQVPVMGFDDLEVSRHLHPALTTIRQSVDGAGRVMVDNLMRIVAGETVLSQQLPTSLVVRESTRKA